jgi:hypothetical protein
MVDLAYRQPTMGGVMPNEIDYTAVNENLRASIAHLEEGLRVGGLGMSVEDVWEQIALLESALDHNRIEEMQDLDIQIYDQHEADDWVWGQSSDE